MKMPKEARPLRANCGKIAISPVGSQGSQMFIHCELIKNQANYKMKTYLFVLQEAQEWGCPFSYKAQADY